MKNNYVADIGDYGKYGLLRFLDEKGKKIGVNWYLNEDKEKTGDGNKREYLEDERFKEYNEKLFEILQKINKKGKDKSVADIKNRDVIPNAVFFDDEIGSTDPNLRKEWSKRAEKVLCVDGVNLIFADPDNGTLTEKGEEPTRISKKHARLRELRDYYDRGDDVVYYCHKGRRNNEEWEKKLKEFNRDGHNADIIVLSYHRGTQRSFIFAIHPEHFDDYKSLIKEFGKTKWCTYKLDRQKMPPFTVDLPSELSSE